MRIGNIILIPIGVFLLVAMIIGSRLDPTTTTLAESLKGPSLNYFFGTDHLGRDIFARIAHGFYWDFSLSLAVVLLSVVIGVMLGLSGGYFGKMIDGVLIVVMDLFLSMPHIILAMVIMLYLSYSPTSLVIALVIPGWVKYSRIVRAHTYAIKEADFIAGEKLIGAGPWLILFKHILPNVIVPVISLSVLHLGHTLLAIASLGFLGLGLQPPTPEWGTMLMESRPYILIAPWTAIFPGGVIFLFIMFFTILGYKLENTFNPVAKDVLC